MSDEEGKPQFPCTMLDCEYVGVSPQALGLHRYHIHGIEGKDRERQRKNGQTKKVDDDITANDIVGVVLTQLFPAGGFPVSRLTIVLDWVKATEDFLERLRA